MSVSVPAMVSVSEGDGTVEVCATLSTGAGVTTDIPISISLSTLNGKELSKHLYFIFLLVYQQALLNMVKILSN